MNSTRGSCAVACRDLPGTHDWHERHQRGQLLQAIRRDCGRYQGACISSCLEASCMIMVVNFVVLIRRSLQPCQEPPADADVCTVKHHTREHFICSMTLLAVCGALQHQHHAPIPASIPLEPVVLLTIQSLLLGFGSWVHHAINSRQTSPTQFFFSVEEIAAMVRLVVSAC